MLILPKPADQGTLKGSNAQAQAEIFNSKESSSKPKPVQKEKPKEAPEESSGNGPKMTQGGNRIIISGESMSAAKEEGAKPQQTEKPKVFNCVF